MSVDFYFEKWKKTLTKLDELISIDREYQESKAHDKQWCDAVRRLTGMLGQYMYLYTEIVDCCNHNLQVQKAGYMIAIVNAVVERILELKGQLRKLVGSEYQFMGHGLTDYKLTTDDVVLSDVFPKCEREENVKSLVLECMQRAKDRNRNSILSSRVSTEEPKIEEKVNWWDNDNEEDNNENSPTGINVTAIYELEKKEDSPEILVVDKNVALIQAHERSRKIVVKLIHDKLKREKWEKDLNGTLRPPARKEIRERSAKIIQIVFRAYFDIKRKRVREYKRDERLDLRLCTKLYRKDEGNDMIELNKKYVEKFKEYEKQWNENYDKMKQNYIDRKRDIIEDDIRDEIMYWFRRWFDEALFFRYIPPENDGGSVLIVKEEIPTPKEWLEKYEEYLARKNANKNKNSYDQKLKKQQAKEEKLKQKKAEHLQKKMEEQILKKMMKNPKFHPGYQYPESKKIEHLIQSVEDYKKHWSHLDFWEEAGVKEKFVSDIDMNNACMEVHLEVRKTVDVAMRDTFKVLIKALTEDYKRMEEEMPEQIKEKKRRKKKQRKHKIIHCEDVAHKLEELAHRGVLKEYSPIKMEEFIGDPNFAGDDLRCTLQSPEAFAGETKGLWWERCRELTHGSRRVLLVGEKGTGKTTFVYVLVSMNDAMLYEIDPAWFPEELLSPAYLRELAQSLAECARATQPSVIFIRHIHRLYYRKTPPEENKENLSLMKRYLLRILLKKIRKTDKIVIAASCIDPWKSNSNKLLKQFPNVVLLPSTNYSTVVIILNKWLSDNPTIPRDLNVQSLAHVLQGYSFGHIKDTLNKFLTADRIIKIAVYGLPLQDLYQYFLDSDEIKIDYKKYLTWYTEKTQWGKKGKKLLEEQKEFQQSLDQWQQQQKKKKKNLDVAISDVSTNVN